MKALYIALAALLLPVAAAAATPPAKKTAAKPAKEIADSLKLIKSAADAGDPKAQSRVGTWYYTGRHVEQNFDKAFEYYSKAAQQNEVSAIGNLGYLYQHGLGVERDSVQALKQFFASIENGNTSLLRKQTELADAGDVFSCILLGRKYAQGKPRDLNKAVAYLSRAAEKGDTNACRELAMLLLNSRKGAEAFRWFEKGADAGDITCIYYCGRMLRDGGMGVRSNPQKGIAYLTRAADAGFPAAAYQLGQAYSAGLGVARNIEKAREYFLSAAQAGNDNAAFNLAKSYTASPADFDRAIEWFAVSVPKAHQNAFKRLFQPSDTTLAGSNFEKYIRAMDLYEKNNLKEAEKMFKKIEKNVPGAKTMLAVILMNKNNPKPNLAKGIKQLEAAARLGDPRACFLLAKCLLDGIGVKQKDPDREMQLLEQAINAPNSDPEAVCFAGDIYYEGLYGQPRNLDKAVGMYLKAGRLITPKSAQRLADCYANGLGGLSKSKTDADKAANLSRSQSVRTFIDLIPAPAK